MSKASWEPLGDLGREGREGDKGERIYGGIDVKMRGKNGVLKEGGYEEERGKKGKPGEGEEIH